MSDVAFPRVPAARCRARGARDVLSRALKPGVRRVEALASLPMGGVTPFERERPWAAFFHDVSRTLAGVEEGRVAYDNVQKAVCVLGSKRSRRRGGG